METLYVILGSVLIAGIAIMIYEHRKKITLLKHDLKLADEQTEVSNELERSRQGMREAHIRSGLHNSSHQ